MWAHGAMGPIVIAAIFWPRMTYVGALWIVTFPAIALALAEVFRRTGAIASAVFPAAPARALDAGANRVTG
jgi:hypothetical protein